MQPGEPVQVHFTCRFPDGALAASTEEAPGRDPLQRKSPVFVQIKEPGPLDLKAGERFTLPNARLGLPFEYSIADRISDKVTGLPVGKTSTVLVSAERQGGTQSHTVPMALVRTRPKVMTLTPQEFTKRTGSAATVGQAMTFDPDFPGTVKSVSDTEVVVTFASPSSGVVQTPFGNGTVSVLSDHYEVALAVHQGDLVRTGPLVGVISEIKGATFTVDFSHPFGGETLTCEVLPEVAAAKGK